MKNILVPVDYSDATAAVIESAVAAAQAFGAKLTLLHVVMPEPGFVGFEPGPESVREAVAADYRAEHRQADELKQGVAARGMPVEALCIQGVAEEKIVAEAERLGADLIVMGSHGHGALYNLLVGSVTGGVLRRARCPVLVVPSRVGMAGGSGGGGPA